MRLDFQDAYYLGKITGYYHKKVLKEWGDESGFQTIGIG